MFSCRATVNLLHRKRNFNWFPLVHELMNTVRKKNNNFTIFWLQFPNALPYWHYKFNKPFQYNCFFYVTNHFAIQLSLMYLVQAFVGR